METVETRQQLAKLLATWEADGQAWAFVPTMGALHDGHLALCRAAARDYPRVVASVFVNPTQFDRADDLAAYPRQPARDAEALRVVGVDALFSPAVEEVYPTDEEVTRALPDLGGLDQRYEGAMRPGHFGGVVQVVRRLVDLVRPAAMYMGQKDAQQLAVVRRAAREERWPVAIHAVPTVRESSGLAMSSRNARLSPAGLARASRINAELERAGGAWLAGASPGSAAAAAKTALGDAGVEVEYFDFVDPATFEPLAPNGLTQGATKALIVAAAWVDGVRLIDNRPLARD